MGLDVTFYKAKRKEWNEYSKGKPVDLMDTTTHEEGLHIVGEVENCPELTVIGNFRNSYEMVNKDIDELYIYEVTMDKAEELYNYYDKGEGYNPFAASWFLMVLNTFTDDDILLMHYF